MTLIEGERSKVVSSQEATKSVDKEERSNLIDKKESNELTDQVDVKTDHGARMVVGLTNLGNTCYMNTVLQLLFSVPSLTAILAEDEKLEKSGIGRELQDLLKKANSGEFIQLNTAKVKQEIGLTYTQYMGYNQHDAHELLIELLDHIHECLRCEEKAYGKEEDNVEGVPADRDFVVDTSMGSGALLTRKEENNSTPMNITPPNIPNIVDENLNSLSLTPQKGRVHENLPINLMEDRPMDTAIHENIHHNIATSKPTLTEKFSLNTDGNIFTESPPKNVHIEISTTGNQEVGDEECCRSVDSNTPLFGNHGNTSGEVSQPDSVWMEWLQRNASIITDTFFGQFVTHTTCCHCGHTVVNYAPFNHISLPLPGATDRHIVVTWIAASDHQAYRYLVTVSQFGKVSDLKTALLSLLDLPLTPTNISIAEVFRNKVHIVHETETLVKHVNDSRSSVYAYERCVYDSDGGNKGRSDDANFFSNNLDTDSSTERGNMEVLDANIEVNIDVTDHTKQFKNKLELFNPEAKIENRPKKVGVLIDWSNCVICLEDFPPHLLLSHEHCNMTICGSCYASYSDCESASQCPVCRRDFSELLPAGEEHTTSLKWNQTPLHISYDDTLVGHPYLLELPSKIDSSSLLKFVSQSCPVTLTAPPSGADTPSSDTPSTATLYLSDGMLLRKEVVEGEEYTLLSSHSLLVVLSHPPNLELLAHITDTLSLKRLEESLKPLELQDCLNAFVKSDELCAGSTWYCALCEREQSATTSTSVSHLPPYLILQLNRFDVLNSGVSRTEKITCPVHIPQNSIDLSLVTTSAKPVTPYSLCGIVHHTGGIGGGHYTSSTITDDKWHYFNDTMVTPRVPMTSDNGIPSDESDARSAYVLLYRQDCQSDDLVKP